MSRLEGRRTVITGAASGIGEQTARLFVAEGVGGAGRRRRRRGRVIADELGDNARFVHVDVASRGGRAGHRGVAVHLRWSRLRLQQCRQPGLDRPGGGHRHGDVRPDRGHPPARVFLASGPRRGHAAAGARQHHQHGERGRAHGQCRRARLQRLQGGHRPPHPDHGQRAGRGRRAGERHLPGGIATSIFGRGAGLDGQAAQATVAVMETVLADVAPMRRSGMPLTSRVRPVVGR